MKRIFLILLISLVLILGSSSVKAYQNAGAGFEWTCIGQDSFLIKLTLYRDCNGMSPGSASIPIKCATTGSTLTTLSISATTPIDVTPVCANSCSRCSSSSCAFPYGFSEYTYTALAVLSNAAGCCKINMSYRGFRRTNMITTIANPPIYVEAELDRCLSPCDNSPSFTDPPFFIACIGQDFNYYQNLSDNNSTDSLSFELTPPLSDSGTVISFTGSYTYDKPFYFWGFPNKNLPFPRGFHVDPVTGDVYFRPMKIETSILVLKVKEWRKDSSGVMQNIGYITRDVIVTIISCPGNLAPVLGGPYYKEVCANDTVKFNISTIDYDTDDTLTISWNNAIPAAYWSDNNDSVKHPIGNLTWTPGEQHARPIPYVFTVTVKDDACPISSRTTRAYQILVKPLPKANITVVDSGCGDYYLYAQGVLGINPSYSWVGNFNPGFMFAGPSMHYKFNGPGKYPYTLTMEAQHCQRVYYDTIEVDTFLTLQLTPDHDICYGDTSVLTANYSNNKGPVSYKWSTGDTTKTIYFPAIKDTTVQLTISDSTVCEISGQVHINIHNLPAVDLGPDKGWCSIPADTLFVNYSFDESTLKTIRWYNKMDSLLLSGQTSHFAIADSGYWRCTVEDSLGCLGEDDIQVFINPLPKPDAGIDVEICTGCGNYPLIGLPQLPAGMWRSLNGVGVEGSPGNYYFNPKDSAIADGVTYQCVYHYTDGNGCENEDTVAITVYETPVVDAGPDYDVLINTPVVTLGGSPAGGSWSGSGVSNNKFYPPQVGLGSYDLTYTFINVHCAGMDTMTITVIEDIGMKENSIPAILVYPNPTSNELIIKFLNTNELIHSVYLINLEGKLLDRFPANSQSEIHISGNSQPSGLYYLKIESSNGAFYYRKILIE